MRAASRDPRGRFSFDVQPVLLAVFCPRLFQCAGLVLRSDIVEAGRNPVTTCAGSWRNAANENKRKAGAENVEFLKGEIEHIPLPDSSVDVIISNCVINLSADKDRVLREAFRVLKPGGRLAVSDVVTRGEISPAIRQSVLLWVGCVAGALEDVEYRDKLAAAGFEQVDIEPTRVYRAEAARDLLSAEGIDVDAIAPQVDGKFMGAFVRGVKPTGAKVKSTARSSPSA